MIDSREQPVSITGKDLSVYVVEYRPVYMAGDVAKSGEQPFRPGMTVRQAVAVAGGYDVARYRLGNPFTERTDLRAQYETLWTQHAKDQLAIWRLRSELGEKVEPLTTILAQTPLPKETVSKIAEIENEQLKARTSFHGQDKAALERATRQVEANAAVLREQKKKEEEGANLDASEYAQAKALYDKGSATITRVSDARRAMLLSQLEFFKRSFKYNNLSARVKICADSCSK